MAGIAVGKLTSSPAFSAGAAAGLAGMVEIAAGRGRASSSIVVGYGYTGILIAFLARQNPLAVIPVASYSADYAQAAGCCNGVTIFPMQRYLSWKASCSSSFWSANPLYGRLQPRFGAREIMMHEVTALGWWGVPIAVVGGRAFAAARRFFSLVSANALLRRAAGSISAWKATSSWAR